MCDYYYFKSNTTDPNATPANKGYPINGYFYMQKVEIVNPTIGSTTGSTRQGNIITSYTYGRNYFMGPSNQTLTPGTNKELRSVLISPTGHNETGIANSWGCYLYTNHYYHGTNEYQIVVEWDNTAGVDDISKVYLLKTLS